jgi:hypothetical protein
MTSLGIQTPRIVPLEYVTCHPAIVTNVTVGTFSGSAFTTAVLENDLVSSLSQGRKETIVDSFGFCGITTVPKRTVSFGDAAAH